MYTTTIPKEVIRRAISHLMSQGVTPFVPCAVDGNGQILPCAAAAVAEAGIGMAGGASASKAFESHLGRGPDLELVQSRYSGLGWDEDVYNRIFSFNTFLSSESRAVSVIKVVDELMGPNHPDGSFVRNYSTQQYLKWE